MPFLSRGFVASAGCEANRRTKDERCSKLFGVFILALLFS